MPNFNLPDEVFLAAAKRFGTPLYLYDEQGIRDNITELQKAFSWNKKYKQFFAIKALPNPVILKLMAESNCGLDASSEVELLLADMVSVSGENLFFSANAMPKKEIKMARDRHAHINLDDISDIDTLLSFGAVPENLCLRFNPGGVFDGENSIMGSPGESKYGFTKEQLYLGLKKLKQKGLQGFGLHAFLSSNSQKEDYYPRLAELLISVGKELESNVQIPFEYINLSGGMGIPYKPEDKKQDIYKMAEGVKRVLQKNNCEHMAVYTEMGRYITGPYGFLLTHAMHEKNIYKRYIGVDACASNLLRPAMYGAYHHIHVAGKRESKNDFMYDITGCLCENNDKFAINRKMPKIDLGDLLIIHDCGAHAHSMGYQYNGRLRCAEVLYTKQGDFKLIRRNETPEDYFNTLVM
jgi:diaminopimelate decarboxylase